MGKIKHKKLSMTRVFSRTKPISYKKAINEVKLLLPNEDIVIANYMKTISKNKKSIKIKKV
jgi:hypothetical protein